MSTNDQDYKTGMLQGGAPFNAAPEQPAVPVNSKSQFRRITAQGGNPVMAPSAQAQDGLVERLRHYTYSHLPIAIEAADRIAAQASEIADLRENGQRLVEAADGWKAAARHFQQERNDLGREIAELKAQRDQASADVRTYKTCFEDTLTAQMTHMQDAKKQRERAERAENELGGLREEWSKDQMNHCALLVQQTDRAERAEAERDALREDALRYRWLRDQEPCAFHKVGWQVRQHWYDKTAETERGVLNGLESTCHYRESLDAAIDAAKPREGGA